MRRSLQLLVTFSVLLLVFTVGSAFAGDVTMTFEYPGGNSGGGVYTYPYYFSVNGGPVTPLACDSFDNEITPGQSWTANETSLLSDSGWFHGLSNSMQLYEAAGLIFEGISNGSINAVFGNWAIWGLFSSNARNNPFYQQNYTQIYTDIVAPFLAEVNASNFNTTAAYLSLQNIVVMTPLTGGPGQGGPQEFLMMVPEPTSLALLGSGLLLFAGLFRKRLFARAS